MGTFHVVEHFRINGSHVVEFVFFNDTERNTFRRLESAEFHPVHVISVVKAVADYHAPARFDDEIKVRTWISKVGTSSIRFDNEITRLPENELLCAGHTVHVLVDKGGKPIKVPQEIRKRLSRTK